MCFFLFDCILSSSYSKDNLSCTVLKNYQPNQIFQGNIESVGEGLLRTRISSLILNFKPKLYGF